MLKIKILRKKLTNRPAQLPKAILTKCHCEKNKFEYSIEKKVNKFTEPPSNIENKYGINSFQKFSFECNCLKVIILLNIYVNITAKRKDPRREKKY